MAGKRERKEGGWSRSENVGGGGGKKRIRKGAGVGSRVGGGKTR